MEGKLKGAALLFPLLLVAGTLGYHLIEHWTLIDSFFMTVITLSTVGYAETHPLSVTGKLFTSALILIGVGTLAFIATRVMETVLERGLLRRRRLRMEIRRLTGHVILCGFGRMGQTVIDRVREREEAVVVVEKDEVVCEQLERRGIPYVRGDATDDAALLEAGVARARALAAVLPHDADNLYITLTARQHNPELVIVCRASNQKSESKILAAGATHVLNPYRKGGRLMARQLLQPTVMEFIDLVLSSEASGLEVEEVRVATSSSLAGMTLRDAPIRKELDIIIVGVRRGLEPLIFNPSPDLDLAPGDVLVALGRPENLRRLEKFTGAD